MDSHLRHHSQQLLAADPQFSIWVSAAAGTGKTKILVDRLLRLMIDGAVWQCVLCLTFTNAAANEMRERIGRQLRVFASLEPDQLRSTLHQLLGRFPTDIEIHKARQLFARYCQEGHQLKIFTIHAFCQYILRKFALESGISPYFTVIDELKVGSIIRLIKSELIAAKKLHQQVTEQLKIIYQRLNDQAITSLLQNILTDRIKFQELFKQYPDAQDYRQALLKVYSIDADEVEHIVQHMMDQIQHLQINSYAVEDIKLQEIINYLTFYVQLPCSQASQQFEKLKQYFLTQEGTARSRLITKLAEKNWPELSAQMKNIQHIVLETANQLNAISNINFTTAIFVLAQHVVTAYRSYKADNHYFDYDDLILQTKELLTNNDLKEWILYKLEGGIYHLLIDEAQDTSESQWQIIEAIISDFFAGAGARDLNRTIFVVGDDKQSIYSFQGACLRTFYHTQAKMRDKMHYSRKEYRFIDLNCSYRSNTAIVKAVQHIFSGIKDKYPQAFSSTNLALECFRNAHAGTVELWPITSAEKDRQYFWTIPEQEITILSAQVTLATQIANYIREVLESGLILPSTNQVVKPHDFMILLRSRTRFANELTKALQTAGIPIMGIDKVYLMKELAVLDLLAAAKFVLFPEDDLNLASLLKSPIIGISEELLQELSYGRETTLWQVMQAKSITDQYLKKCCDTLHLLSNLHRSHNLINFFHVLVDGLGYRSTLSAISPESNDAIDEFLLLVDNFYTNVNTSMQAFIIWLEQYQSGGQAENLEIKRDIEHAGGIKITTIHGAKGLQAGIVILADTTTMPQPHENLLWTEHGLMLWGVDQHIPLIKECQQSRKDKEYLEYLRLLYVALTRAADKLVICGYQNSDNFNEDCWYSLISKSFQHIARHDAEGNMILEVGEFSYANSVPTAEVLTWQEEDICSMYQYQEPVMLEEPYSPLRPNLPVIRGRVIHKLLEDIINHGTVDVIFNHPIFKEVPLSQTEHILQLVQKLVDNTEFWKLVKCKDFDWQPEVGISAKGELGVKIGRIDLLAVSSDRAIIIDYKSDRYLPLTKDLIPIAYRLQLEFYEQAIKQIYPQHQVCSKILWTTSGYLMDIT